MRTSQLSRTESNCKISYQAISSDKGGVVSINWQLWQHTPLLTSPHLSLLFDGSWSHQLRRSRDDGDSYYLTLSFTLVAVIFFSSWFRKAWMLRNSSISFWQNTKKLATILSNVLNDDWEEQLDKTAPSRKGRPEVLILAAGRNQYLFLHSSAPCFMNC